MTSPAVDLDAVWRDAWRPPEKYRPSEWAAKRRYLPREVSAEPGPWRNERTPYLVGIMDAIVEEGVEETVFVAGTQLGKSEAGRNVLGYFVDNDPGPYLLVMPDEKSAEDAVRERIQPMLRHSPSLARHVSDRREDNKLSCVTLDSMAIYVGWAGSAQSLATRPCRYVEFDEIDKYPPFSGVEADPISLGMERTKTYLHRKRVLKRSTPTTRDGPIWRAFEACGDRRRFHVPCPHCGEFQQLVWTQVKWPKLDEPDKNKYADEITVNKLAWYECAACKGRIEDRNKPAMLSRGVWVSDGQAIDKSGKVSGDRPKSPRVGFHLSSLYSPWVKFCDMVAKFILAKGDIGATMNFRNSWLAEPFEVQVSTREPSKIRQRSEEARYLGRAGEMRIVPNWSVMILATADVQKDHCYWAVTAWGYEQQSKRLAVGIAASLDEVYQQVFYPAVPFVSEQGGLVQNSILVVDSGF
ncbi:MAG TPA: terminase gpA endonuclease subunit, partial [Verrucomicrobiae bacterium]|nr:terminase gpA endonuclease subunit [Verrucomicrobiae bacterium]